MKPSIERELEAIRQLVRDLETRLKNERSELGHRVVFDYGRKGEVPAPTEAQRGYALTTDGWAFITGSGGGGAGTPDGHTLAVVTGVLNAEPLSGTVDARFKDLSGSIDARFAGSTVSVDGTTLSSTGGVLNANPLSGTINAAFVSIWSAGGVPKQNTISGSITGRFNDLSGSVDGHFNALSGTINATLQAVFSASQVWTQTANGTEGTILTAVIPIPYAGPQYYAFITNSTGSNSPVYRIRNKTSASFQVVSTAPFSNGDRIDFLTISGGLGPVSDGSVIANLSGTIDARFFNLSGTIDARFTNLSGSINSALSTAVAGALSFSDVKYHPGADSSPANALDDEFNGTALDAKWTGFVGNGTVSASLGNSSVVVYKTWSVDCVYGYKQAFSPGTSSFTFETRLNMGQFTYGLSVFSSAGIGVTDGTRYAFGTIMSDGAAMKVGIQHWSNGTTFVADSKSGLALPTFSTISNFPYPLDLWLRLDRAGNHLTASYSANGYDYALSTVYTNVLSGWGSITGVGIMGQNAGGDTRPTKPRYFYFRRIA